MTDDDRPTVIRRTPDELRAQRAALIASTGMAEELLRERAEAHQLYPEHHDAWEAVRDIDYLLAGCDHQEDQ